MPRARFAGHCSRNWCTNLDLRLDSRFARTAMARTGRKHECASTINSNPITRKRETSMSSKTKRNESIGSQATSTTTAETQDALARNSAREEEIKLRAYEIYLERGEQPGRELDDWLQAERELELEGGALSRAQAG